MLLWDCDACEFFTIGFSDRSLHREKQKTIVKNCPQWGWKPGPLIKSCSIDSRNEQSPTCEVVHETNKAHFWNLQPNRLRPSSVGKALAWRSRGPGFNSHWGQFLKKFFFCSSLCKDLTDNLTETPIVKNSMKYIPQRYKPVLRWVKRLVFWSLRMKMKNSCWVLVVVEFMCA